MEISVRSVRLVVSLVLSGLTLLVAAIALSALPAGAATERDRPASTYRYTDHPSRVSSSAGRVLPIYIGRDFDEAERERIVLSVKQ